MASSSREPKSATILTKEGLVLTILYSVSNIIPETFGMVS